MKCCMPVEVDVIIMLLSIICYLIELCQAVNWKKLPTEATGEFFSLLFITC